MRRGEEEGATVGGLSAGSLREPPRRISCEGRRSASAGRDSGRGAERGDGVGDAPWKRARSARALSPGVTPVEGRRLSESLMAPGGLAEGGPAVPVVIPDDGNAHRGEVTADGRHGGDR
jgi:hypothetical protein